MKLAPGEWTMNAEVEELLPSGTSCVGFVGDTLVGVLVCGIKERTSTVMEGQAAPDTGDGRIDKIIALLDRLDRVSKPNIPEHVRIYNYVGLFHETHSFLQPFVIAIHSEYGRRGYGWQVTAFCEQLAREKGCQGAYMQVGSCRSA